MTSGPQKRIGVVLFNLGGPDTPDAVEPFLRNLFSDPAILRIPSFVRGPLAWLIANRRTSEAKKIYAELGGGSPILPQTEAQASALEKVLSAGTPDTEFKTFIAMRYWHPRAKQIVTELAAFAPDLIVLLPLYPQFSTTTTASSLDEFRKEMKNAGLTTKAVGPCCYPVAEGFVSAYAGLLRASIGQAEQTGRPRVLFSAHGLPERIVNAGDPYVFQIEKSAAAIVAELGAGDLDWRVTYQSRVGPLKWVGPATDNEIVAASKEGLVPVICPIAFVSEHSETLVELDIEYRQLAEEAGAPGYVRVPTVGTEFAFIESLAGLVRDALKHRAQGCFTNSKVCPAGHDGCLRN